MATPVHRMRLHDTRKYMHLLVRLPTYWWISEVTLSQPGVHEPFTSSYHDQAVSHAQKRLHISSSLNSLYLSVIIEPTYT